MNKNLHINLSFSRSTFHTQLPGDSLIRLKPRFMKKSIFPGIYVKSFVLLFHLLLFVFLQTAAAQTGPLTITCPGDHNGLSSKNDPGLCTANVDSLAVTISDPGIVITSVTWNMTGTVTAASPLTGINNLDTYVFDVGTTVVTYKVKDAAGDSAVCNFNIEVYDNEPPTIACPPALNLRIGDCNNFATGVVLGNPTTGDNCGITTISNNAPAQYPVNNTYVIWTVDDSHGLSSTCKQLVKVAKAAPLSININNIPVSCLGANNGNATAIVAGGLQPLSFSWNTVPVQTTATVSNLAPGTYIVTVTDNDGCFKTASVVISEPSSAVSASVVNQTNVTCFGSLSGSVTVAASGGTPGYTYSIDGTTYLSSGTFSGLAAGTYSITARDLNGCTATIPVIITQPVAVLSAAITAPVNVPCFGQAAGSATVTAAAGTAPYTYAWNTVPPQTTATATNLTAGTWIAAVTDALGCTTTASVTITEPAALSASTTPADVVCFGNATGIIKVSATGGTPAYAYSLNGGTFQASETFADLVAGTYTVTVKDAHSCTVNAVVTIAQPASGLNATTNQVNVACFGQTGRASVATAGGIAPYSYAWNTVPVQVNDTASNLVAGTYIVTVTDATGCTTTAGVTITQPTAALSGSITGQLNILCFGTASGSVTIAGSGGTAPYQYSLSGGVLQASGSFPGLVAGNYTATVSDANNCTFDVPVTISQPASGMSATIESQTNEVCFGQTNATAKVIASGGVLPYTYAWNTVPAQFTATAVNLAPGTYTVTVGDGTTCTTSASVTITEPTVLLASIDTLVNIPCTGQALGSAKVTVSGGTLPYAFLWNNTTGDITRSITNVKAGTYVVTVTDAGGCTTTASVTLTEPASALTASITNQLNVACFGNPTGAITVFAGGGTPAYQFSLDGIQFKDHGTYTNLLVGTYKVIVRDTNSCVLEVPFTITEPGAALSGVISKVNVACFAQQNGSLTMTATGGTLPYAYSWNTVPVQTTATAVNLAPGNYSVLVTDSLGCTIIGRDTITGPAELLASITNQVTEDCAGNTNGSVTVQASGGTPAYQYSLNGGINQADGTFSNLAAGSYTVTTRDAGNCTYDLAVTITLLGSLQANEDFATTPENTPLNANVMTNDRGLCFPPVTVISTTTPANGAVVMLPDGTFTYTPVKDYYGADFFSYTIADINGNSATAQVTLTITYVNSPPVAVDDRDTTSFNKPVTINILANDSDRENGVLTVSICASPANGTITGNSDKTITYTPNTDFTGNDGFCYTICDDGTPSLCDSATVFIYVKPDMLVYNGFSPNGDGINDHLVIRGIEDFPENEIEFFNRYGDKIRKISNYNNNSVFWDGTNSNGKPVPDGTYFYILKLKDASTLKGWIFIRGKK